MIKSLHFAGETALENPVLRFVRRANRFASRVLRECLSLEDIRGHVPCGLCSLTEEPVHLAELRRGLRCQELGGRCLDVTPRCPRSRHDTRTLLPLLSNRK